MRGLNKVREYKKIKLELMDSTNKEGYLAIKVYNCLLRADDVQFLGVDSDGKIVGDTPVTATHLNERCDQGTEVLFNIQGLIESGQLDAKVVKAIIKVGDIELGQINIGLLEADY
ncbi:hypothetical protein BX659_102132 [Orenia metallireducens]|jgi:hypothetical protein|uniref:hypothetical protein n=1 Tax=Orenia metallireducens TaxID=1413210 RepID=UPI000D07C527|nr:hypothetical protein [Orenia metallireducens]PRX34817.1 hypothetical protein BX659_102132 [Orenia metallireducens]